MTRLNASSPSRALQSTAQPEPADPWPVSTLCARPRPVLAPRLVAGGLLALLAARFTVLLVQTDAFAQLPGMLAALLLGGCLWWVAHRQVGVAGAVFALVLFVAMPEPLGWPELGAVGLFAMLYTAVGVAHAMQGPRRKWKPRLALMGATTGFTALVEPTACVAGLLLAMLVMVYLAEQRRRFLFKYFLFWTAVAAFAATVGRSLIPTGWGVLTPRLPLPGFAGVGVALVAAACLWLGSRRSRYFGNTAPLIAALALPALWPLTGERVLIWSLPFSLLFIGGVFADVFEGRRRGFWLGVAMAASLLQALASTLIG